jgi:uncharacterized membrane protein YccF (DUF307 family)
LFWATIYVSWCLLIDWWLAPCHFVDWSHDHASCISLQGISFLVYLCSPTLS